MKKFDNLSRFILSVFTFVLIIKIFLMRVNCVDFQKTFQATLYYTNYKKQTFNLARPRVLYHLQKQTSNPVQLLLVTRKLVHKLISLS